MSLHDFALKNPMVGCLLTMQVMYECNRSHSETLAEAVPEAMKNVLLVMATQGVLTPAWTVSCSCHTKTASRITSGCSLVR